MYASALFACVDLAGTERGCTEEVANGAMPNEHGKLLLLLAPKSASLALSCLQQHGS